MAKKPTPKKTVTSKSTSKKTPQKAIKVPKIGSKKLSQ
jgi:hypothetical protein